MPLNEEVVKKNVLGNTNNNEVEHRKTNIRDERCVYHE
jgi:hypothetical protein